MLDLILAGGTIIDGTGGKRVSGDVGIAGDRIVGVGDLSGEQAGERIDRRSPTLVPAKEVPGKQAEGGSNEYRRKHDL